MDRAHLLRTAPAALAALIGCTPIMHGPVVERGISASAAVQAVGSIEEPSDGGPIPHVQVRYGFGAPETERAYLVGIQANPLLLEAGFVEIDAYAQLGRSTVDGGADWGAGATIGRLSGALYAQYGRIDEENEGWYTSQQVILYTDASFVNSGAATGGILVWSPSIAWQWTLFGRNPLSLSAGLGVGTDIGEGGGDTVLYYTIGGMFELVGAE